MKQSDCWCKNDLTFLNSMKIRVVVLHHACRVGIVGGVHTIHETVLLLELLLVEVMLRRLLLLRLLDELLWLLLLRLLRLRLHVEVHLRCIVYLVLLLLRLLVLREGVLVSTNICIMSNF